MAYTNQPLRSESIPSFPPPPMSATLMREQTKRKPKSRVKATASSSSGKLRPIQRSRIFLLPILLILSFTVLILGVIYAYCVASRHTLLTDAQLASPSDVEINGSIFGKRELVPSSLPSLGPIPTTLASRTVIPEPAGAIIEIVANGTREANHQSRPGNKGSLSAALIFYTLTSPLFTIMLVSAELILASPFASGSSSNSIPSPIEEPRPRSRFSGSLNSRRAHLILISLTALNIASMTITSSFWTHCELPIPAITQTLAICPAEVRGHWMGGIHEVSIAKVTLSWLVVIGLVCHTFFVWRNMRSERRRWALGEDHTKTDEVDVAVEMEEGKLQRETRRDNRVRFQ